MRINHTKTFVYKRVRFSKGEHVLKPLLSNALELFPLAVHRNEPCGQGDDVQVSRLVGQFIGHQDEAFYGVLMRYTPGSKAHCLVNDERAAQIQVDPLDVPPNKEGKQREILDGQLYFAVVDNHVVMLQSFSMRAHQLELHLQWLLWKAGLLPHDTLLHLDDQPQANVAAALEQHDIQQIVLAGDLAPTEGDKPGAVQVDPAGPGATAENDVSNMLMRVFKSLTAVDEDAKIETDEVAQSDLRFSILVKQPRGANDQARKTLNVLGRALRNAEIDTTLKLKGGGQIRREQLRLSGKIVLEYRDGAPDTFEVWTELFKWLTKLLQTNEIPA